MSNFCFATLFDKKCWASPWPCIKVRYESGPGGRLIRLALLIGCSPHSEDRIFSYAFTALTPLSLQLQQGWIVSHLASLSRAKQACRVSDFRNGWTECPFVPAGLHLSIHFQEDLQTNWCLTGGRLNWLRFSHCLPALMWQRWQFVLLWLTLYVAAAQL